MKKIISSMASVFLIMGLASITGCSYFSSKKAPEASIAPTTATAPILADQPVAVVEIQELEVQAVEVPADPATSSDTQIVVQAVEVDAIGVIPANQK